MKQKIKYLLLLFVLFCTMQSFAQNNDATAAYKNEPLAAQTFDGNKWKASTDGMQYTKKVQAKKTKKQNATNTGTGFAPPPQPIEAPFTFRQFAQTVLIFFAVIILAFIVFKAIAGDAVLVNKQIVKNRQISLDQVETNLHEADVEGFLQKALTEKDYRLAVRLYYLAIVKELSLKHAIEWKKDKTNGHYMNELRAKKHPQIQEFRNVTRIFEYVWYSNMDFDGKKFEEVRIAFKDLLNTIK